MKVALIQSDTVWHDPPANLRKLESLLEGVSKQAPELVCVPEMFASGYTKDPAQMEDAEGPTFKALRDLARRRKIYVQGTFPERCNRELFEKGYNTSVVFDPDGVLLCRYHKMHPFTLVNEHHFYNRGDDLSVFKLGDFSAATPICYDLRFPEIFRQAMYRGANLFIVPANWPVERQHHWRALLIARAIENLSYVIGINRVGTGGGLSYAGPSMVIAPAGEVLLETDTTEQAAVVDIDANEVKRVRERFGFLNDVRGDRYPDLFSGPPIRAEKARRSCGTLVGDDARRGCRRSARRE